MTWDAILDSLKIERLEFEKTTTITNRLNNSRFPVDALSSDSYVLSIRNLDETELIRGDVKSSFPAAEPNLFDEVPSKSTLGIVAVYFFAG